MYLYVQFKIVRCKYDIHSVKEIFIICITFHYGSVIIKLAAISVWICLPFRFITLQWWIPFRKSYAYIRKVYVRSVIVLFRFEWQMIIYVYWVFSPLQIRLLCFHQRSHFTRLKDDCTPGNKWCFDKRLHGFCFVQ